MQSAAETRRRVLKKEGPEMAYLCGFIGTGNMGGALVRAAARSAPASKLILTNRTPAKAEALAKELGCAVGDNRTAARESQYLFLGVKPQLMAGMLREIAPALAAREDKFVLVSMAAGLTMADLTGMLGVEYPIIRIMPNTPVAIGEGVVLYDCNGQVTEAQLGGFLGLMAHAGLLDRLDESLLDAGSAVSGCGGAYCDLFLEALADGGVACGLPRAKALRYAAQMAAGSAKLLLETDEHPGALKDAVCSPGGTTIQGVRALERGGFRSAAFEAVIAAYEKTAALRK